MATESLVLQKLFEVVGHAYQVQFNNTFAQMDTSWVDISKYEVVLMNMNQTEAKLSKY